MNLIGTYSEFLFQQGADANIFDEERSIVSELLKSDLTDIVFSTSDEDYEFCDAVSDYVQTLSSSENKEGYSLYNIKFNDKFIPLVWNYAEGGLVCVFFNKKYITHLDTLFTK